MAIEETVIFTIGHSRHPADHFFTLLARHQIRVLVDVRSQPHSRFSPQFNKKPLEQASREHGLEYIFLGKSLGGRPEGSELYNADGSLNYERRAMAPDFVAGIEELLRLAADKRVVLMCAEEDPEKCHRWLLVGKSSLVARGFSIIHIRGDGTATPAEPQQTTLFDPVQVRRPMPRIAVTSDLHFDRRGYLTTPQVVDDLVLRLQVKQVNAVIIAGDLGHPSGDFAACLAAFRRLSVPVAVLAGNHDVWRDEDQGWSSRDLWERRLPSLVKEAGFIWLEDSVLRLGDVAVVGSLAWYDYSAAPASVPFPPQYFAAMKKNLNNDAVWIDWPWSDVEFAAELRDGLLRRLGSLEVDASVREVVVVTHVPLFDEQIVRKPGDRSWEISNAYFGNLTTGHAVLRFKKIVHVISGHTHVARQGVVGRAAGPDLTVSVIGSDYGTPELEVLEVGEA